MKPVVSHLCGQTVPLAQWRGFGRLTSSRLSKETRNVNVNVITGLNRQHVSLRFLHSNTSAHSIRFDRHCNDRLLDASTGFKTDIFRRCVDIPQRSRHRVRSRLESLRLFLRCQMLFASSRNRVCPTRLRNKRLDLNRSQRRSGIDSYP